MDKKQELLKEFVRVLLNAYIELAHWEMGAYHNNETLEDFVEELMARHILFSKGSKVTESDIEETVPVVAEFLGVKTNHPIINSETIDGNF